MNFHLFFLNYLMPPLFLTSFSPPPFRESDMSNFYHQSPPPPPNQSLKDWHHAEPHNGGGWERRRRLRREACICTSDKKWRNRYTLWCNQFKFTLFVRENKRKLKSRVQSNVKQYFQRREVFGSNINLSFSSNWRRPMPDLSIPRLSHPWPRPTPN